MDGINFSLGEVEYPVNGGRVVRFNPTDMGFVEILYSLAEKLQSIETEKNKKLKKTEGSKQFDVHNSANKRMEYAVDAVFGDGFCADVFHGIRLVAFDKKTGLTIFENFMFAIIDQMDESMIESMEKRSASIEKYTAKYKARKNDIRPSDEP